MSFLACHILQYNVTSEQMQPGSQMKPVRDKELLLPRGPRAPSIPTGTSSFAHDERGDTEVGSKKLQQQQQLLPCPPVDQMGSSGTGPRYHLHMRVPASECPIGRGQQQVGCHLQPR